jgi:hypothetical protein
VIALLTSSLLASPRRRGFRTAFILALCHFGHAAPCYE